MMLVLRELSYGLFKASIIHAILSSQLSLSQITRSLIGESPLSREAVQVKEVRGNKYKKCDKKYDRESQEPLQ
jgi:hypothetical protein